MDGLFNKYVKIYGECLNIAENCLFKGFDGQEKKIKEFAAKFNYGINSIVFEGNGINEYAKIKIKEIFEIDYEEHQDEFLIEINTEDIKIYGKGLRPGLYALSQIFHMAINGTLKCGLFYCFPAKNFRGIKIYFPKLSAINDFYELIDISLNYGYNKVILEAGGAMKYDRHPEINSGWAEYCKRFSSKSGASIEFQNKNVYPKNSIHWENGCGEIWEKNDVKALIKYCRDRGFEVIPEVPSLSHSDYLLLNHRELAERPNDECPNTYCPSNSGSYNLLFDVLEEVIEVFEPETIHIGHDEWYDICLCDKCKKRLPEELYAEDINKIINF